MHALTGSASADSLRTPAYQLLYELPHLVGPLSLNFTDLNEGFLPQGRRDEIGAGLGYYTPEWTVCRLGAAVGADLFFSTTTRNWAQRATNYSDQHGFGWLLTAVAQCRLGAGFAVEVREDRVGGVGSFSSSVTLVGLVYTPGGVGQGVDQRDDNEGNGHDALELLYGRRTINDYFSAQDKAWVWSINYRHALAGHVDLEGRLLDEGHSPSMNRYGAAAELAAHQDFVSRRIQLFIAAGPYLARQLLYGSGAGDSTRLDALIDFGVRWQLSGPLALTGQYARVLSTTGKDDTDIYLLGLGYALR